MNEEKSRRLLRQWDPAADAEPPSAELYAAVRSRLAADPSPRPAAGWLSGRWWLAAATLAGTLLVAVVLAQTAQTARIESRRADVRAAGPESAVQPIAPAGEVVQVVYTASNGVRVYWSLPTAPASRL